MRVRSRIVTTARRKAIDVVSRPTNLLIAGGACLCLLGPTPTAAAGSVDFTIDSGKVVPSETFAAKVSVLGAAITSSGEDMPVTVRVKIGGQHFEPFGPAHLPLDGNVNDHGEAKHFVIQGEFAADEDVTITGRSYKRNWHRSGAYNGHYTLKYTRNSHAQGAYVKVLRDGDAIPSIPAFQGQSSILDFVAPYVDVSTGLMSMDANQTIYLYELGTSNLGSSAADFQDLVVLVTLGKSVAELENNGTMVEPLFD